MLVHAVKTYLRRNKEILKDKLTSSHSKFGIKINLRPFIFPAILLDVDGMLLAINCQQYPAMNTRVKMEVIASSIAGNIARCGCPFIHITLVLNKLVMALILVWAVHQSSKK